MLVTLTAFCNVFMAGCFLFGSAMVLNNWARGKDLEGNDKE